MGTLRKLARQQVGHRKSPRVQRVPFGYARKMSDVIVELAQPMLSQAKDPEQYRLAIGLAAMGWNLSLMPADKRPALMEDLLREFATPEQPLDEVKKVVGLFIARKEVLFPDDKRLITTYRVSGGPTNANIVVEYAPPADA